LFVVHGVLYAGMYPLWEGWDEPSHFAYLQHVVENNELPQYSDIMSNEIRATFTTHPLNRYFDSWNKDYGEYWNDFDFEYIQNNRKILSSQPLE